MRIIVFCIVSFLLHSCGKSQEQLADSAKQEAMYFLTKNECAKAKDALDSVDYQTDDAHYISLYSDVYACVAGYTQLGTAIVDMSSLNADSASLFKTMAAFNSAQVETTADSSVYTNILNAIKQLLFAGGSSASSASARITKFGAKKAGDLHLQALLLIVVEMGKYFKYYGDVDTNGAKGAGGNWNCLAQYTDGVIVNASNGYFDISTTDTCTLAANTASAETQASDTDYERRLCEGIVLFNNFRDIISNISFSTNSTELGDLVNVGTAFTTILSTANSLPSIGTAITDYQDIKDFDECEALALTKGNELQRFFITTLESFHN